MICVCVCVRACVCPLLKLRADKRWGPVQSTCSLGQRNRAAVADGQTGDRVGALPWTPVFQLLRSLQSRRC